MPVRLLQSRNYCSNRTSVHHYPAFPSSAGRWPNLHRTAHRRVTNQYRASVGGRIEFHLQHVGNSGGSIASETLRHREQPQRQMAGRLLCGAISLSVHGQTRRSGPTGNSHGNKRTNADVSEHGSSDHGNDIVDHDYDRVEKWPERNGNWHASGPGCCRYGDRAWFDLPSVFDVAKASRKIFV